VSPFDVLVVGGGVAGLSTAWHLLRQRPGLRLAVLEREWACGTHASGMNAAIFRHLDFDEGAVRLAVRSRALMEALQPGLVRRTGALYLAKAARLREAEGALRAQGVAVELLDGAALSERFPALVTGALAGAFVPDDGVIDTHGLLEALQREVRAQGGEVRLRAEVLRVERGPGQHRVTLASGDSLEARHLVFAGGAWSARVGALAGLAMPVEPRRRHLALLESPSTPTAEHPVVWRLDDEVYFRPESGGALASPCDEEAWTPEVPPTAPAQLARLGELLTGLAPSLASAQVRRAWGCLRSFAPDREFVVGGDPRADGISWLAGLGGRGMTCGLALGELAAAELLGGSRAPAAFSLARLLTTR
jgi:glycine/D-amino acid oxidase-like deaminating enzyme